MSETFTVDFSRAGYATEMPTLGFRWFSEFIQKPPRLQQAWSIQTGGLGSRIEWRDVPTVIEEGGQ